MTGSDIVETQLLRLRRISEEDADSIWLIHSDPRTNRFNPVGPMSDRSKAEDQARDWAANWATHGQGYWAVEERHAPGVVIGFGGIRRAQWRGRQVYNLYYRLSPTVWGRGLAGELVGAAVSRWQELGKDLPLVAYTTAENRPPQRTAAKGGLVRRPDLDEVKDDHTEVVFALGLD